VNVGRLQAILWDVDGVLAETERDGHRIAFNRAFEACGRDWQWDEARYGELLRITGGRERLMHDMNSRSDAPVLADQRETLARELHAKKNAIYAGLVDEGRIALRAGVGELMQECAQRGVRMGIATTTSRGNVEALLQAHLGSGWAKRFGAVVCGEDVRSKKPDPEVYLLALQQLGIGPLQAVAIEDSPGGAAAGRAADVPVIVTRSHYFAHAPIDAALAIGPGLHTRSGWRPGLRAAPGTADRVGLDDIENWCAEMDTVSGFP
jgi:HAD superfamily hydrolase (TIGR01509 family)